MPATLNEPMPVDEPEITHDPPIGSPVLDDSNIKAMAAKFKTNWPAAPADGKPAQKQGATEPNATGDNAKVSGKTDPGAPEAAEKDAGKPGELADEPDIAQTEPLNRERWKKLYQSKEDHKARAKRLEAEKLAVETRAKQLEEDLTKTKSALPPNLEEVQKALADSKRITEENKRLSETLETINLERSPRFQNWWKAETSKHIKVAQQHVPAEHREEFAKLLLAPASPERNAALDAIVEPLPPTSKRLATGALEAVESLKIQREDALTQGSERWKELQAHERAESEKAEKAKQTRMQAVSDEAVRRAKSGYTAFQPSGDATADSEIPKREAFIRAVVAGKLDEDTMLNIPAAAVEGLHLRETVVPALKAELAKANEIIKQLQGSSPRASDGKGSNAKPSDKDAEKGNSFASTVLSNWAGKK